MPLVLFLLLWWRFPVTVTLIGLSILTLVILASKHDWPAGRHGRQKVEYHHHGR
jgi:hypothetical protein